MRPHVVITVRLQLRDRAESETRSSFRRQCLGRSQSAIVCRDLDCVLAHFSTDYVFGLDETRRRPTAKRCSRSR